MQSNYIAKFAGGELVALYSNEEGILARTWLSGRWLPAQTLLKGALPMFGANFALSGELQIYAQDEKGSVVLINFAGHNISSKTILENKSEDIYAILFSPVGSGGNMNLIYNIPYEEGKQKLIVQKLQVSGVWDKPVEVDIILTQADNIFETFRINENHALIFYRKEGNGYGYREISAERLGEFVPVLRQGESLQSYSFFAAGDSLHMVYLSSNMFSSRLVYRRKIAEEFEAPIILWEGQWLDNCLLSEINGELCLFFQSGGNLYTAKSVNNGESFSKPENYQHKFCRLPKKAIYISENPDESYKTHHIFVDSAHPWDIQILPDISDDFYVHNEVKPKEPAEQKPQPAAPDDIALMDIMKERMEKLSAENQEQRAQIAQMIQTLSEHEQKEKEDIALSAQLVQNLEIIRKKDEEIAQLSESLLQLKQQLLDERAIKKVAEIDIDSEGEKY